MKKKIFAAALASAMLLSLAGCNQDNGGSTTTQGGNDTQTPTTTAAEGGDTTEGADTTAAEEGPKAKQIDTGYKLGDNEGKVLNVYCWNEDFKNYFEAYYKVPDGLKVNWVVNTNDGGVYQQKLDEALLAQADAAADDKVDMFLAEADYIKKYANADATSALTYTPSADIYSYTLKAAQDVNGTQKGLSFQAAPSVLIYRRSIAKDVLGTDDPAEVQKLLGSWADFDKQAAVAKEKGYIMTGCVEETLRCYTNNAKTSFLSDDNTFQVPEEFKAWLTQAKTYVDNGWTLTCGRWDPEKTAQMGKDGKVMCFFGPAWYYNFCMGTAKDEANGDWAVCVGPQEHFWGGTWLLKATGTDNEGTVEDIMKAFSENKDVISQLWEINSEFSCNKAIMEEYAASTTYGNEFLGGQNDAAIMAECAKNITWDPALHTQYDQIFQETLPGRMLEYMKGDPKTEDEAWQNFYKDLKEKAADVKVPA